MIGTIFEFAGQIVEVRINDVNVLFRNQNTQGMFAPMEGIQLDKKGVIKEHPDLKDDPEWEKKGLERFKEKIKSFPNETTRMKYIINDLKKFGYKPLHQQKAGHKPIKLS